MQTRQDGMEWDTTEHDETGHDRTGRNREGAKIPSDGNKEEEEGDEDVIILCSMDVERVIPGGEAEQKFTQNSSRGTACSTRFRRIKRRTEHLVSLHFFRATYQKVPNSQTNRCPVDIWLATVCDAMMRRFLSGGAR
ncbi:hypothetical protein DVH24_031310 [Malus domestica]|uniref:Uncharacterized protein n=1 Tax=Malus domestica TaxID=3750 RepID=A0A498HHX2_MALDO|nr:hypothetical protein DVH24_031310 [Malus domestica]